MIADISLENFRSYKNESFEFNPAVNIIVGPNASGKTNLLEAVLVQALGSSYRAKDSELISFEEPWSKLSVTLLNSTNRQVRIKKDASISSKEFIIDEKPFKRLSLDKTLPVVLFEPNHLQMLVGAPELRRSFLDELLIQTIPGYTDLLRQYKRSLSQRNRLLKNGYQGKNQLFVWNVRLSELGARITESRSALVEKINSQAEELYRELSNQNAQVEVNYLSSVPLKNYASDLLGKLEASTELDFARGFTAYGPHREDMLVVLNKESLDSAASRGENRTMTLVFKILEAQIVEKSRNLRPMLLLDDVFSELDGARRQALTKYLQGYQTFITTTDADVVVQHFTETAKIVPINIKR